MDTSIVSDHFSFLRFLMPSFISGINDGINPCGVSIALIFVLHLSIVGRTRRRVLLIGLLFILSTIAVNVRLTMGLLDVVLVKPVILDTIRYAYLMLAVGFLGVSGLSICDWWRYRKYSDVQHFYLRLPVFLREIEKEKKCGMMGRIFRVVVLMVSTMIVAGMSTFMGAVYPQAEYIYIVHSYFMAGGDQSFALLSFLSYGFAMALPVVVTWFVVFGLIFTDKKNTKVVSYYKGISAALFLSTGIGLGYYFLR